MVVQLSNEPARLDALHQFNLLDTLPEQHYDDLVLLASQICNTPIALISLVDENRQWFKARVGLTETETARSLSFCTRTIEQSDVLVVEDTLQDARFANEPLVTSAPHIRFYAGAPLITADGHVLGTICVIDHIPRSLSEEQLTALKALRNQLLVLLENRRHRTLAHRVEEFTQSVASTQNVVYKTDTLGHLTYFNPAAISLLKYSEQDLLGMNYLDLIRLDYRDAAQHFYERQLLGRIPQTYYEFPAVAKDGTTVWIGQHVHLILKDTEVTGFSAVARDITERKHVEEALLHSEQTLKLSLKAADAGTWDWNIVANRIEWSETLYAVLGLPSDSCGPSYESWLGCIHEEDREWVEQLLKDALERQNAVVSAEYRIVRHDRVVRWVSSKGRVIRDSVGSPLRMIGVTIDITERKHTEALLTEAYTRAQQEATYLSHHDPLTALPNNSQFEDDLTIALVEARQSDCVVMVILVDIDRFKGINAALGRRAGDTLLKDVAARITTILRDGDGAYRVGADEFAFIIRNVAHSHADAFEIIQQVQKAVGQYTELLKAPFYCDGVELFVNVSCGISLFPLDAVEALTLQRNATVALRRAQQLGGNNHQFYSPEIEAEGRRRLDLENGLRRALERREFLVYYQPKIDTQTGKYHGAEALIRWQHPTFNLVSPAEFIPLAEDTGMITAIGEWLMMDVCQQVKSWLSQGLSPMRISLNLSPRQFLEPTLVHKIREALRLTGLTTEYLELELTEGSLMKDVALASGKLRELRAMGLRVAVDDFGTGYSSLGYLSRLPLDSVKIDRAFVRDMVNNPDDYAIVSAIIELARTLRLRVVAEGVETDEQARMLRLLRCEEMQGYLFGRPMPAAEFRTYLEEIWMAGATSLL